jgi:hypothetical protein
MEIRKLAAPDRPREQYRYTVKGSGVFPWDMLRYDAAYPASQEAVNAMTAERRTTGAAVRKVELRSYHAPTPARWESFGWVVAE